MLRIVSGMMEKWAEPGQQPPSHMWFGVSVESQKYADERIPLLLQTPAAVRFLSVEPMLEAVNIHLPHKHCEHPSMDGLKTGSDIWKCNLCEGYVMHEPIEGRPNFVRQTPGISWVICGGESGPKARPFHTSWAERLQTQCEAAGVPLFMLSEIDRKMAINRLRKWNLDGTGHGYHVRDKWRDEEVREIAKQL
jgi:protein gp37